jgi:hypothetical protein
VLLTRSPLIHPASWASPFDLHVLSTPPAFVLSQNQTLRQQTTTTHQPKPAGHEQRKQSTGTNNHTTTNDDVAIDTKQNGIDHLSTHC